MALRRYTGVKEFVGERGDVLLRLDLGPGVSGQRVEGVILVQVEFLTLPVDGAAPGKEVARYASLLGDSR